MASSIFYASILLSDGTPIQPHKIIFTHCAYSLVGILSHSYQAQPQQGALGRFTLNTSFALVGREAARSSHKDKGSFLDSSHPIQQSNHKITQFNLLYTQMGMALVEL